MNYAHAAVRVNVSVPRDIVISSIRAGVRVNSLLVRVVLGSLAL